jgi:integrase
MNIKRNIVFSLENRKKNGMLIAENMPIRMRVAYEGERVDFSLGYRIDLDKWDDKKGRVKNGCSNKLKQSASQINADLLRYETEIQDIFKEFEVKNTIPTPEQLRECLRAKRRIDMPNDKKGSAESSSEFFAVLDEFVKECSRLNNWSASTKKKFDGVKIHLETFNPKITFDFLNEAGLNAYLTYLRDDKKFRNTTINKQLGFLKWFLRWCIKKGYTKDLTYETFKPKLKNVAKKVIFLTWEELTTLQNYKIPEEKQYLERVRDVFLFCCFTGLRHSDVHNLRTSDIKANHIEITTIKTADSLIIELNKYSKAILKKYKDVHFEDKKVLPVISNQKMNTYLKELAELAELNEPVRETYYKGSQRIDTVRPKHKLLGTHAGRRTFICNALSLGIPTEVVMKWTGHADYSAMKPYIDIADNIKADAMDKFNKVKLPKNKKN